LIKKCINKIQIARAKNQVKVDQYKEYDKDIRKLFVGGIPALTTFAEFKEYFQKFGEISDIMLPTKSKDSKLNCGFGFVTYQDAKSAYDVLNFESQHSFRAKWVE